MSETNPYEAPQHSEPQSTQWRALTPAQVTLMVVVVLVILRLFGVTGD